MNTRTVIALLGAVGLLFFASCGKTETVIPVTSISINKTSVDLVIGETVQLSATVSPADATEKTVTWTSSNSGVATVDNGKVTAVAEGTANITATAGGKTVNCEVIVKRDNTLIVFADPNVKAKLVAAFDKNGDGELSYEEAAAVVSPYAMRDAFGTDGASIKSFDEFQFFTGINFIIGSMFVNWSSLSSIVLPEGVYEIEYDAFRRCSSLTSITIPKNVTRIGDFIFSDCTSLSSIILPDGLEKIPNYAFERCERLSSITIPGNVEKIGDCAFGGCTNLSSVSIPKSVRQLGHDAFQGCVSLTSIILPDSLEKIGDDAFSNCSNLASVNIPEGVTYIGKYAFHNCSKLSSINLPKGIDTICIQTFYGCSSLASITIPKGVTFIQYAAFYGCSSLTSVDIPEGVTYIGDSAFYGCSSLTSAVIPNGVGTIENYAFDECPELKTIKILSVSVPTGGINMFGNETVERTIFVPAESLEAYKTAQNWSQYASKMQAIPE